MKKYLKRNFKRIISYSIVTVVVFLFFYFIFPVAKPLLLAFLTAIFINPFVELVKKKTKMNRTLSVSAVFLLFISVFLSISSFLVFQVVAQTISFVDSLPLFLKTFEDKSNDFYNYLKDFSETISPELVKAAIDNVNESIDDIALFLKDKINIEKMTNFLSKLPSFAVSFVVYLISLFLFLLELPDISKVFFNFFDSKVSEKIRYFGNRIIDVMYGFLRSQLIISIVVFLVSYLFLLLVIPNSALTASFAIWIVDLIPVIGSSLILIPWVIYLLLVGNISLAIKLSILTVVLAVLRRILEPKVMGSQMGMSPLLTLISMFVGFKLIGVLGLLLGPIFVILITSANDIGLFKVILKKNSS